MQSDDADVVLAFEGLGVVRGVYQLDNPPPPWPRLIVALEEDTPYALGAVTGKLIRALPHRDRSHIGIASSERLKQLWMPMMSALQLSEIERHAALRRATTRAVDEPPVSMLISAPFQTGSVWTFRGREVVALPAEPDPFPSPRALLVVVSDHDATYQRIERATPRHLVAMQARSLADAKAIISGQAPVRIVCSESVALGDGLLDWVAREHPALVSRFEILCTVGGSEWLGQYLGDRSPGVEIREEPLEDEGLARLMERARRPS